MSDPATELIIGPQPGPQEAFLASRADLAIYGGAAGSGKTWALLLDAVRWIENPDYGAVIFRRSYPEITNQGGLWDESYKLYPRLKGRPNNGDLFWRFPSGARISFAHLQHEQTKHDYQGSQITLVDFDELTHFTSTQVFYLLSRNRSTCGIRPYARATCNPDADSWVAGFIAWWIDQESGLPIPERSGIIRWMVRNEDDDTFIWADTRRELLERFPEQQPTSVTFVPAKLSDNQILMQKDPGYRAKLLMQPLVERERLLGGNWKIRPTAGKVFNRGWFEIVDAIPAGPAEECRFWDFAATEKKMAGDDPDFTSSVKIRRVFGTYYVIDCIACQSGPMEVERLFKNISQQDVASARAQGIRYKVRWEIEPGSAARRENVKLVQMLAGLDCAGVDCGRDDKITRAKPLARQAEVGNVKLLRGPWNEMWLAHMHSQPAKHDDIMDASSGSFNALVDPSVSGFVVGGTRPEATYRPPGAPGPNLPPILPGSFPSRRGNLIG